MRDPIALHCPRCGKPAVVVDWSLAAQLVAASTAEGAPAPAGFVDKIGAAMVQKLHKVPGRVVGPHLRRLLSEGAAGDAWCCAACAVKAAQSMLPAQP